jgi:hypothetical protein
MDNDKDWDEDSYEVELEEKFEQLKSEHLKEAKKHNVQDLFRGEADERWFLPKENLKPNNNKVLIVTFYNN